MGKDELSSEAYTRAFEETTAAGSATFRGEQRMERGLGLDPLVDPAGFGLIRRSLPRFITHPDGLQLAQGLPMPVETRFDTTGSMGRNVAIAINVLRLTYGLLTEGGKAVLKRYDVQIANGIINDRCNRYISMRSQFEMAAKIVEQLTMMAPEGGGRDEEEDHDYGLFAAAYLTDARIEKYGLMGYDFTVSDAPGRGMLERNLLHRVYGDGLYDALEENGHPLAKKGKLPTTKEVVEGLIKRAHAFFLQVGDNHGSWKFWSEIYGEDRVVTMHTTEHLPYFQAGIIGLTEGVLELSNILDWLKNECQLSAYDAKYVANALRRIPVGAQKALPGFDNIPKKGDVFARKEDLWPIGHPDGPKKETKGGDKKGPWL